MIVDVIETCHLKAKTLHDTRPHLQKQNNKIITLALLGYKCFHNYKVFLDLHRIMCGDKL